MKVLIIAADHEDVAVVAALISGAGITDVTVVRDSSAVIDRRVAVVGDCATERRLTRLRDALLFHGCASITPDPDSVETLLQPLRAYPDPIALSLPVLICFEDDAPAVARATCHDGAGGSPAPRVSQPRKQESWLREHLTDS
ncbi:MAG: hypothetical protein Q7R83_03685 [bacterium]|nr:hypothetical protein [bacterium]